MPWMLQPKSYTQIARPNLYNVAYRRVGAYKGMGRLHPTNYLEIGVRPNRIGATTGQYSTLSGQLSLFPPSLRGFGQVGPASISPSGIPLYSTTVYGGGAPSIGASPAVLNCPGDPGCPGYVAPGSMDYQTSLLQEILTNQATAGGGTTITTSTMQTWLPWLIGGALFLVLLARR